MKSEKETDPLFINCQIKYQCNSDGLLPFEGILPLNLRDTGSI